MKRYEVIREIFNKCSGNQMRDVYFDEMETDSPALYVNAMFSGYEISRIDGLPGDSSEIFEIAKDGLFQRLTFNEI